MGIPVPNKKPPKPPVLSNIGRIPRSHSRRDDFLEYSDNEGTYNNHVEDLKRGSEMSRMGNYFNIVIAPPPIKALQPRKMLLSDEMRIPTKRMAK